jgi:hypothetical protein
VWTIARNPSHFGSNAQRSSSAGNGPDVASMGSTVIVPRQTSNRLRTSGKFLESSAPPGHCALGTDRSIAGEA